MGTDAKCTRKVDERLYDMGAACEWLAGRGVAVSPATLYRERQAGRLSTVCRRGMQRCCRVRESELRRWLREEWA